MALILTALRRIGRGTVSTLFEALFSTGLLTWDLSLSIVNLFTFKRKVGSVTPKGHPGEGGVWPEYIPPQNSDSRCSCPALNAMANHGIVKRDGRDISFKELSGTIRSTYNFSPSFCLLVPRYIAHILNRSYSTGRFDLADIDVHNGIEHDASLVRRDAIHQFHQGLPDGELVAALLKSATGPPPKKVTQPASQRSLPSKESPYFDIAAHVAKATADFDANRTFTATDLSRRLSERRREAKANNGQYSQDTGHKIVGSANGSTLLTIFGGRLDDIHTFLTEERFPEGWESRIRDQMGLTLLAFNRIVFQVELGIDEEVDQPLNLM
ncbi:Cloroperoxidase [Lactarius akahatsu]|uniref:Cloroperoxidase n=1 Tax=Lactarius akahatsu TaxID=416441 RepID=A0AAD4LER0_9AGAM|nr:Cloroperoxidase [Lactarius akahatsu]